MDPPFFPVRLDQVRAGLVFHGACESPFQLQSIRISPIFISHPNRGVGYEFVEGDKSFVFLTDNELTFEHPGGLDREDYLDFAQEADLFFHDAEYRPEEYSRTKGWGHSIYLDALDLALEAGVKQFGLFHHNQDRTDDDLDAMVQDSISIIESRDSSMGCFAVASGFEIEL
jgi:ribonuclease BN (tRNA processing enzyme)